MQQQNARPFTRDAVVIGKIALQCGVAFLVVHPLGLDPAWAAPANRQRTVNKIDASLSWRCSYMPGVMIGRARLKACRFLKELYWRRARVATRPML